MSLPSPKLDDRDWNSLVEEARRRIATNCPHWTDFNPSDPGMTLLELMAWLTETTLYQLNRVPDVNFIKLLDLVGVRLQPACPARAWACFEPEPAFAIDTGKAEKDQLTVPQGMHVTAPASGGHPPIPFVTREALNLAFHIISEKESRKAEACRIIKSCWWDETTKATTMLDLHEAASNPGFSAGEQAEAERMKDESQLLYLGDLELARFGSQTDVEVSLKYAEGSAPLFQSWEAWTGDHWEKLKIAAGASPEPKPESLYRWELHSTAAPAPETLAEENDGMFPLNLPSMKPCNFFALEPSPAAAPPEARDGVEKRPAFWLRVRPSQPIGLPLPTVQSFQRRIRSRGFVLPPDSAVSKISTATGIKLPPHPLSLDEEFYPFGPSITQEDVFYLSSKHFQHAGATIEIKFNFKNPFNKDLDGSIEIEWQYKPVGQDWTALGAANKFVDGTDSFTRQGVVKFVCPADMMETQLAGNSGLFIRAKVTNVAPVRPVEIKISSVFLQFTGLLEPWLQCVSDNFGRLTVHPNNRSFQPFIQPPARMSGLHICLDRAPDPNRGPYNLYLDVVPAELDVPAMPAVWEFACRRDKEIVWEALPFLRDGTGGFVHEGIIQFGSSKLWHSIKHLDSEGCWLRARVHSNIPMPHFRQIQLNTCQVEQCIEKQAVVGSSDGSTPNLSFSLALDLGILDRPELWVRETDDDSEAGLEKLGLGKNSSAVIAGTGNEKGWWVGWKEVRNFSGSKADSHKANARDFMADLESGTFTFGDGEYGAIPPPGEGNIKIKYRVTLGMAGNVGPGAISVLEGKPDLLKVKSVRSINEVCDGADRENLDHAKERGPYEIRHGGRAVTEEDFIQLAQKSSTLVGRAFCYSKESVIYVIIVPNLKSPAPVPGPQLLSCVRTYLDDRRLINTQLKVIPPTYTEIKLQMQVALVKGFAGSFDEVKKRIREALDTFVHPLTGGHDGSGWEMGRPLHLSELFYRIESLTEIDHVANLKMWTGEKGPDSAETRIPIEYFPRFGRELNIERVFEK